MRIINYSAFFIYLYAGTAPRLRKASVVRNHTTPVDFVTDLYQSQLLRYPVAVCQIVAQFIWMCSNVAAIKNDFNQYVILFLCCYVPSYWVIFYPAFLLSYSWPVHSLTSHVYSLGPSNPPHLRNPVHWGKFVGYRTSLLVYLFHLSLTNLPVLQYGSRISMDYCGNRFFHFSLGVVWWNACRRVSTT